MPGLVKFQELVMFFIVVLGVFEQTLSPLILNVVLLKLVLLVFNNSLIKDLFCLVIIIDLQADPVIVVLNYRLILGNI